MKKVIVPGVFFAALSAPVLIQEAQAASNAAVVKYVNVESNSSLNVRKSASSKAGVVTTLKKGKEVTVLSESNGWAKITVDGKTGYVSSDYLTEKTNTYVKYVSIDSNSTLNVRTSPNTSSSVVTKIAANTKVEVLSDSNGWSKIKVNGKQGYVASKYLSDSVTTVKESTPKADTATKVSTKETKTETMYVNVDQGSSLNMRNKPSNSGSVIVKLAKGVEVTAYSDSNGWTKIKVYGKEGYVATKYLSKTKSTNSVTDKTNSNSSSGTVAKTTTKYVNVDKNSTLNMRSSASTSGSVVTKLSRGTKVTVTSESNGWAKITVSGKTGYVSTSYLTTTAPNTQSGSTDAPKDPVKETPTVTKYVNVDKNSTLNMRSSASTSGSVVTKLSSGTKVTVTSESNGWAKITVSGKTGYVSTSYLTTTAPGTQSGSTDAPKDPVKETPTVTKYVNVDKNSTLNMRSNASTSGSVVTKLARGTAVTVISESNGWTKITASGKTGYVSSSYLTSSSLDDSENPDSNENANPGEDNAGSTEGTLKYVNVDQGSSLNMRKSPSSSAGIVAKLAAGTAVTVYSEENGWAKVTANGQEGYVSSAYLTTKQAETPGVSKGETVKTYVNYDMTLDEMATIQMGANPQTDKAYDVYIREDAVAFKSSDQTKGTIIGSGWRLRGGAGTEYSVVNSVQNGQVLTITSKVKGSDGYYWYKVNSTQSWVNASKEDTTYYLNPDNFINTTVQSMQFLKLSAKADINDTEVNERILAGKGILSGKASSFITAANAYGINEVYLISHALLETGNGTSTLAKGVTVNGKTVYNMYGIGAYDGSAISSGAQYAYNAGWFTPEAAIIGGAKFIAQGYINAGQDTLYKMRWNPGAAESTGKATHQYATDIGWASKQVTQIYNLYSLLDSYILKLEIPKYK
ncbi:SH3 domain-containing protein [Niallia taxi]|uniref:SH3 domain-containing protein n=1 Tax=Niallia taxi TaxID=2499688 RepID=UPI002E24B7B7|nr:SH3 domain-containing protein [Niallia taxi]MED4119334.1 SH3 domain-containing protein [Niallia taxi]